MGLTMPWDFERLEDGDAADADSVNDVLAAGREAINNVDGTQSRRGTFNHHHASSIVPKDYGTIYKESSSDAHIYDSTMFTGSTMEYASGSDFGSNSGTEAAPLADEVWVCIGHPTMAADPRNAGYTDELAKVNFTPDVDFATDPVKYIWVLFNCQLRKVNWEVDTPARNPPVAINFCIQFRTGGQWWTISASERPVSVAAHLIDDDDPVTDELINFDVPISTFITPVMVNDASGLTAVQGVRAMVSVVDPDGLWEIQLYRWNLTCLPIYARTVNF